MDNMKTVEMAQEVMEDCGNSVGAKTIAVCALAGYGAVELGIKIVKGARALVKLVSEKKAEKMDSAVEADVVDFDAE